MSGTVELSAFDTEERAFAELHAWRAAKKMEVVMDEHHSSMGTTAIAICKGVDGKERHIGTNFPMYELGFDTKRGQRFLLFVLPLPPNKKMKPRKNPFLIKYKPKKGKKT
jgi:hypothetical protein